MNAACGVVCGAGTHTCPATSGCFPNDSTLQCGTAASCATCPTPSDPNAEAVCTTNQCGTACKAGFHRCPAGTGACVANTAVSSCGGTSCTACPAPPANGMAACDNVANPGNPELPGRLQHAGLLPAWDDGGADLRVQRHHRRLRPVVPDLHAARERHRQLQRDGLRSRLQHRLPHLRGRHLRLRHEQHAVHVGVHAVRGRIDLRQQRLHAPDVAASGRLRAAANVGRRWRGRPA